MTKRKNYLALTWILCVCALLTLQARSSELAGGPGAIVRMPAVDAIAVRALERAPLAGLSIAVAKGSEIVHAGGYGYANLEHGVPATAETIYRIGSITKQFTAAAILQLVERGKLGLEDDFRKFLPDYPTGDRVVTIRHLLNHTSGIKSATAIRELFENRCVDITQEEMIDGISRQPFDFEPGDAFRYSNSGPWLLGVILENLSNQPYSDYVQDKLFEPSGLENTYYDSYRRVIPKRARGYSVLNGEFVHAEVNSPTRPYASGALISTVLDLVKWQTALFSKKVVDAASLALMIAPGSLNNGEIFPYGFGLHIGEFRGRRQIAHVGGIIGFRGFLSHYPDDDVIIAVLTNTDGNRAPKRIEQEIAAVLFATDS